MAVSASKAARAGQGVHHGDRQGKDDGYALNSPVAPTHIEACLNDCVDGSLGVGKNSSGADDTAYYAANIGSFIFLGAVAMMTILGIVLGLTLD